MFDIIYLGGGLNYAGAVVAAKNGKKVALIERDLNQLGGVCLHKGCIPSKMFLHYSNLLFESKNEIIEGSCNLNMQTLLEKKEKLLANATKAIQKQCSKVELIEGNGKIIAPYKVEVNGKVLEAKYIVIGTGSHPFIPDGIELNKKDIITSYEVLNLQNLPKRVAIYGTGAIGLEMASFFATAGVEVTLIERKDTILKRAHPLISKTVQEQLEKLNVKILFNHPVTKAKSTKKGVHITFDDGSSIYEPLLLVATGRVANSDVVACEDIETNKHGIKTDSNFETTLKDHFAIGDCNGKLKLAHAARAQVLNVTKRILGKKVKSINLDNVVKFIHTLPMSYAYVGKIKSQLEQEGIEYQESVIGLNHFPYSFYNSAGEGVIVSYVDSEGFILGAEILAPNAEELIAIVAMSLAGEMSKEQAKETIFAHPTFSEALERTFYRL